MLAQIDQLVTLSDVDLSEAVSLSEAPRRWLPRSRTGNHVHPSVLGRWSEVGIKAPNGERVFLATFKCGGSRLVTRAAVDAFVAALNPDSRKSAQEDKSSANRRASEACMALEKLGA